MKGKSKISGYIVRSTACAVFLASVFVALSSASRSPKSGSQARTFSFAERVAYQRIIEDVYWRHRVWPKENPDRKPSLDAVMSQAQLENKVAGYVRDSIALEDYGQSITAQQLQAEMDRMARDTKQAEVLRELFEALGNDPAVIAECLARPMLAARLIADFSAHGQTRDVESPQVEALRGTSAVTTLGQIIYNLPKIADAGDAPCTDEWGSTSTANAPTARDFHNAVWTGSEMIIWGGFGIGGGRYDPSTDSWIAISTTNAPDAYYGHTAVWTGSEMIVWGGVDHSGILNTGSKYNPATNSWRAVSTTNAPAARSLHTAIWTGSEMIVWGGSGAGTNEVLDTGGRYDPSTNSWRATSTTNAPSARTAQTVVWTGNEMIIWGGSFWDGSFWRYLNTGGRYNPNTDSWTATSTNNAPAARSGPTTIWTGSEMIVWGGDYGPTGGRYNPGADSWTATSTTNAPTARGDHTAVWTGRIMIVWGGSDRNTFFNTGGRYDPSTDSWTATTTINAPSARSVHTAVWTGSEMIVWGGDDTFGPTNTGGRYCGQYPTPTPTPTPTASPTPTPTPPPPLIITQPNGGEVWLMGSVHEITWEGANLTNSDRLIIQYSRDGGASWFRIAQDVPALPSSYSWRVDNYPTTQGRVKILLQGNREITDQSDANFTVQRNPYITLHRPNGGEVFTIGQYINIHWSRQNPGGNTVDIDYSTDNGATWVNVATQAPDTGFYLWNVPGPATTAAKVRVHFHETPSLTDTSEAVFTIVSP
jgi:N-acetylneuraminic acid mutarotase